MGADKAFVRFEGTPMAARIAATLRAAGCNPIVAIGGNAAALAELGMATVSDRWPGEGPLGGVITALDHYSQSAATDGTAVEAVVVVACDLPRLSTTVVAALVDALGDGADAPDVARAVTDRPQPMCAAWRVKASTHLQNDFANGGRRLLDAVSGLRVVDVHVDPEALINVNTVDDLPE